LKILTILGARPQFIKAGSVSREIAKHKEIKEVILHTGQHYDANMSDIFFEEMKIPKPDYFLGIGGKSHGAMTGQMMEKIEEVALKENPDWIVVYGDTNSTLSGALVASKLHIKLAHIEAGLRSFNMSMPEEVNRIVTDRVSDILFCPTQTAVENLRAEGFPFVTSHSKQMVLNVGDVMKDGAMFYRKFAKKMDSLDIDKEFILCTIHRAENTDNKDRLKDIFEALNLIAKEREIILPLHPRTKKIINELKIDTDSLTIVEPVGYLEMVWLLDNCSLVMSDSGGLQKEAYFFGKFCLTLRDETEWVELVDGGFNMIVGADKSKILEGYKRISESGFSSLDGDGELYGNADASRVIIDTILSYQG